MDNPADPTGVDTSTSSDTTRRVADAGHSVVEAARGAVETARDAAETKLEQGSQKVSSSLTTAAAALRRAADDVGGDQAWVSTALRKSADGMETATGWLAGGDVEHALQNLTSFARRQPVLFLGGGLLVGFVLARVGKTAIEQGTAQLDAPVAGG